MWQQMGKRISGKTTMDVVNNRVTGGCFKFGKEEKKNWLGETRGRSFGSKGRGLKGICFADLFVQNQEVSEWLRNGEPVFAPGGRKRGLRRYRGRRSVCVVRAWGVLCEQGRWRESIHRGEWKVKGTQEGSAVSVWARVGTKRGKGLWGRASAGKGQGDFLG